MYADEPSANGAGSVTQYPLGLDRNRIWWLGFWSKFGKVMAWAVAFGPFAVIFLDTEYATFGSAIGGFLIFAGCAAIMGYDAGNDELRRHDEQPQRT